MLQGGEAATASATPVQQYVSAAAKDCYGCTTHALLVPRLISRGLCCAVEARRVVQGGDRCREVRGGTEGGSSICSLCVLSLLRRVFSGWPASQVCDTFATPLPLQLLLATPSCLSSHTSIPTLPPPPPRYSGSIPLNHHFLLPSHLRATPHGSSSHCFFATRCPATLPTSFPRTLSARRHTRVNVRSDGYRDGRALCSIKGAALSRARRPRVKHPRTCAHASLVLATLFDACTLADSCREASWPMGSRSS